MKKVTIEINNKPTVVPVGCHLRWDVATKCRLVEIIVSTDFGTKEEKRLQMEDWAKEYHVTVEAIKAWIRKYEFTYHNFKHALPGTYIVSATLIDNKKDIQNTFKQLKEYRRKIFEVVSAVEKAPYSTQSASKTRNRQKTNTQQLLDAVTKDI